MTPEEMPPVAGAIVLAGGSSSRMGRDKAWLDAGGRPLLCRVCELLLGLCDLVVVVGRAGQELPVPSATLRVDDPLGESGGGPLVGVTAGLVELARRGFGRAYLAASDAALLTETHVGCLLAALDHADAAVPETVEAGKPLVHPLAGAVRVAPALTAAQALLAGGERSVRALYARLDATLLRALPDPRVLLPCDTPEEWERARRLAGW